MSKARLDGARKYHAAIRKVLMAEWDPIGVSDIPQAANEYDGYIPEIYRMLIQRRPEQEVFDYLWAVETEHMALCGNRAATEAVARRLSLIPSRLDK